MQLPRFKVARLGYLSRLCGGLNGRFPRRKVASISFAFIPGPILFQPSSLGTLFTSTKRAASAWNSDGAPGEWPGRVIKEYGYKGLYLRLKGS